MSSTSKYWLMVLQTDHGPVNIAGEDISSLLPNQGSTDKVIEHDLFVAVYDDGLDRVFLVSDDRPSTDSKHDLIAPNGEVVSDDYFDNHLSNVQIGVGAALLTGLGYVVGGSRRQAKIESEHRRIARAVHSPVEEVGHV